MVEFKIDPVNKFEFDYRLVLAEDPSYEKFLIITPITKTVNIEQLERITDDLPDAIMGNTTRGENFTEEELEILRESTERELKQTTEEIPAYSYTCKRNIIKPKKYGKNERFHKGKSFNELLITLDSEKCLKGTQNLDIPALPPPKRFLDAGSSMWCSPYVVYKDITPLYVDDYTPKDADNKWAIYKMSKYLLSIKGPLVRLVSVTYRFDKLNNSMTEYKKTTHIITFNRDTGKLYYIQWRSNRKGKKYHRVIRNVLWNSATISLYILHSGGLGRLFLKYMIDNLYKRIPDAVLYITLDDVVEHEYIPSGAKSILLPDNIPVTTQISLLLLLILLQELANAPIKWLTFTVLLNSYTFVSDFYALKPREDSKEMDIRQIYGIGKKLRKKNNLNTFLRGIMGCKYKKSFSTLFQTPMSYNGQLSFIASWVKYLSINNTGNTKYIYHWFTNIIKNRNETHIEGAVKILRSCMSYTNFTDDEQDIMGSYIKFADPMIKSDGAGLSEINWYTWRDTFNMARDLNIRLRVNKLKTSDDVRNVHDELVKILNRNRDILNKFKDDPFIVFKSPDKSYKGFKFIQLLNAEELRDEGNTMHHCIASYAKRCMNGTSIVFSMQKEDKHYATLEINGTTNELKQKYTIYDNVITNKNILNIIDEWMKDIGKIHRNDSKTYKELALKALSDKHAEEIVKHFDTQEDIMDGELLNVEAF